MSILNPYDLVGISFWLLTLSLMAITVFLFSERQTVAINWRLSITVAGLVTLIAFFHYLYMCQMWVETQNVPIVYRYAEWFLTGPLQFLELYIVLSAVSRVSTGFFRKLLLATIVMLVSGYVGESAIYDPRYSFALWMTSWAYILYLIWFGQGVKERNASMNASAHVAYNAIRCILTFGWAVYPAGYIAGVLMDVADQGTLNLVYNTADKINKIVFGLCIWHAAYKDSGVVSYHST